MPNEAQKGILSSNSNPITDADVIMTAAIVGYAYERLTANKNCKFDLEVKDPVSLSQENFADLAAHQQAINKINKALVNGGIHPDKKAEVGITPFYDKNGKAVITGGTGDLPFNSPERYNPPNAWSSDEATLLYQLALGTAKDARNNPIHTKLGYQGRGAYTGYVDGRKGGQTGLMSTFRFNVPDRGVRRWIPTPDSWTFDKQALGAPIGTGDDERQAWGIIIDNKTQRSLRDDEGMYFADEDKARYPQETAQPAQGKEKELPGIFRPLTDKDVTGYVHGMIQAIYDVEFHKTASKSPNGGTPYEIAVGEKTSKLASCFSCSIFMEATGYPASSTHLGRGESWCILHGDGTHTSQDLSRTACNDKWAAYCQTILNHGMSCLVSQKTNLLKDDHKDSFHALQTYLNGKNTPQNTYVYANLILDALTVHNNEYKRVNATIVD